MVRSLTIGIVAFGAVVSLAAQTPAPPAPAQPNYPAPATSTQQPSADQPSTRTPPAAPAQSASANKVTYTGCLKPGTTPGSWVLESASLGSGGAAASTDRAVGTSGVSKEAFALMAKPTENLKPHANHKIEVTGVVGPALAASPSPDAAAAASASAAPRQSINVDSFKMVSATCP